MLAIAGPSPRSSSVLALLAAVSLGCTSDLQEPAALAAGALSAERCENVHFQTEAQLGLVPFGGGLAPGAFPEPATLAGVEGLLGSVITGMDPSGAEGQGATHYTLIHFFESPEGSFRTEDRAVCAPAGGGPLTCRLNDVLTIVEGSGVFADAAGSLRNHGTITIDPTAAFPAIGTLSIDLRGRICGAGL